MALETTKWDLADNIETAEDVAAYLDAAFEDGDPSVIAATLGAVARAKGMTKIAKGAGVTREALYKALSADGDPRLSTLVGVTRSFGLRLSVVPIETMPLA